MRDTVFLSFETKNWIWLLRHYLNFLCEQDFIGQWFSTYHHEQEIAQIFTHMRLTNLTVLTFKLF